MPRPSPTKAELEADLRFAPPPPEASQDEMVARAVALAAAVVSGGAPRKEKPQKS